MCVDANRMKFREPALRAVTIRAVIDAGRVEEVRARGGGAGDISFFGSVLFELRVGGARRELELFCEHVEGALEADLESGVRNSGARDRIEADFGFLHGQWS